MDDPPDPERPAAPSARDRLVAGIHALGIPETWTVGGVERDRLMGRPETDVDVMACGITADELTALCRAAGHRPQPLEVAGRLVGVRLRADFTGPEGAEIALARTEVSTGEGHAEFEIVPVPVAEHLRDRAPADRAGDPSLREAVLADLGRRDFTCNAIARNTRTGEVLDPWGGAADIAAGIVRAISPDSFRDDALRAFRMLARMARDGSTPDARTVELVREAARSMAVQGLAGPDGVVPPEPSREVETVVDGRGRTREVVRRAARTSLTQDRIRDELVKTLSGPHAAGALRSALGWGLLQRILPELTATVGFEQRNHHHALTVAEHQLQAVAAADREDAPWLVRLVMLMHDTGKAVTFQEYADGTRSFHGHERTSAEQARGWAARLRLSRADQDDAVHLIANHMFTAEHGFAARPTGRQDRRARRFLAEHGVRRALLLADVRRYDRSAKALELPGPDDPVLLDADAFRAALRRNRDAPTTVKQLAIGGGDLRALGLEPGPEHGRILRELLARVVDDPRENDPVRLRDLAERRVKAALDRST
jgi:tRNA nucleotidyltransferase (CCA-adding enzyme)